MSSLGINIPNLVVDAAEHVLEANVNTFKSTVPGPQGIQGIPGKDIHHIVHDRSILSDGTVVQGIGRGNGLEDEIESGNVGNKDVYVAYADEKELSHVGEITVTNGLDAYTYAVTGGFVGSIDDLTGALGHISTVVDELEALESTTIAAVAKAKQWATEDEDVEVDEDEYSAKHYAIKANTSLATARRWAIEDEDVEVETDKYSALHYAAKAGIDKTDVTTMHDNVVGLHDEITTYATQINDDKDAVADNTAQVAADKLAIEQIYDNFDDRYLGSFDDDNEPTKDNDGEDLVVGALYWNTSTNVLKFYNSSEWEDPEKVATEAATFATTKADAAASSADAASTSESNAKDSETKAATSETNASDSEANASNSEAMSQEWASKDEDSEITDNAGMYSAKHYSIKSSDSAASSATSEMNASTSMDLAQEWASKEEDSEITDNDGMYSALHHSAKAAASADLAATSETNANDSAIAAANSADFVNDLFLGAKSSDPTEDNDGEDLQVGALYYNTESDPKQLKIWNGSEWSEAAFDTADVIKNTLVNGTSTDNRYDKILSSLDVIEMVYTDNNLTTVRYTDDNDSDVYYRDEMSYDSNNNLETVKHYYNTIDLTTESGSTSLTYDDDNNLITATYTEE